MKKSKFTVKFKEDSITIFYDKKWEFLHWVDDEWLSEPSIILSISNAIYLSQRNPKKLLKMFPNRLKEQNPNYK